MSHKREKFESRIGFIFVAAGCAVGIGNVWKFPYLCGQNGGAAFIILYLLCLVLLAFPILICEIAVGRSSQKSCAKAYHELEKPGTRYHRMSYMMMLGNYILMGYYTCICGWFLYYLCKYITGSFSAPDMTGAQIAGEFGIMLESPGRMLLATFAIIASSLLVCSFGVRRGVEKITKYMMMGLFSLLLVLAVNSIMLPGAGEGLRFYLVPDFNIILEKGIGNVLFEAMSQAFFTLSIGMGALTIFGSYLHKDRTLTGEGLMITGLDTLVALMAGIIIIPACFAFSIAPDSGPSLVFVTMPNVFYQMTGGQIWGGLFFLFLLFAALSTVITVFESIVACTIDFFHWSRRKSILINLFILMTLVVPCVLGFNIWSSFEPLGPGSGILDIEDFVFSNNFLPLGALACLIFCTRESGWGWNQFLTEADTGTGPKFPKFMKQFMKWGAPALILLIYIKGYYDKFAPLGISYMITWSLVAAAFLGFIAHFAFYGSKKSVT